MGGPTSGLGSPPETNPIGMEGGWAKPEASLLRIRGLLGLLELGEEDNSVTMGFERLMY
jgi:hypothetical protein